MKFAEATKMKKIAILTPDVLGNSFSINNNQVGLKLDDRSDNKLKLNPDGLYVAQGDGDGPVVDLPVQPQPVLGLIESEERIGNKVLNFNSGWIDADKVELFKFAYGNFKFVVNSRTPPTPNDAGRTSLTITALTGRSGYAFLKGDNRPDSSAYRWSFFDYENITIQGIDVVDGVRLSQWVEDQATVMDVVVHYIPNPMKVNQVCVSVTLDIILDIPFAQPR